MQRRKRLTFITLCLLVAGLLCHGLAQAGAVVPGAFDSNSAGASDDGSWGLVPLGFSANFFGTSYSDLYVNNNGNVTFGAANISYRPTGLGAGYTNSPIIAPFFADVDTSGSGSGTMKYGSGTYEGHAAFGVTWADVGYYKQGTDNLNSFQLILVSRSDIGVGDFDLIFNYDKIKWETGDMSSGSHGLGGISAAVGYSNGTGDLGTYYQFPGSLVNGAFLDSNPTGLIHNSNVGVDGRYVFEARNGDITPSGVPLPPSVMLLGSGLLGLIGFRKKFFG